MTDAPLRPRVVLLDIEGTTTPIAFVHQRLFPYARRQLQPYLTEHAGDAVVIDATNRLRGERAADRDTTGVPPWSDASPASTRASVIAYAHWLMDLDRKSPGLKQLQGAIWDAGYSAGVLHGELFDDVPRAFARWQRAGVVIAIYSSGSELAQRRLFGSTAAGDLTGAIRAFFDTAVGPKTSAASYREIARRLQVASSDILFVSDITRELAAARDAGCDVRLCLRPGNAPQPGAGSFETVDTLDRVP